MHLAVELLIALAGLHCHVVAVISPLIYHCSANYIFSSPLGSLGSF